MGGAGLPTRMAPATSKLWENAPARGRRLLADPEGLLGTKFWGPYTLGRWGPGGRRGARALGDRPPGASSTGPADAREPATADRGANERKCLIYRLVRLFT